MAKGYLQSSTVRRVLYMLFINVLPVVSGLLGYEISEAVGSQMFDTVMMILNVVLAGGVVQGRVNAEQPLKLGGG